MMRTILATAACLAMMVSTAGQAAIIVSDDFDPGIEAGTFQSIQNAAALGDGQPGFLSGNALHFGNQSGAIPFVITNQLDVSSGGMISFEFRGGNEAVDSSSFWEDSEGSFEWADLAYSIDGGMTFVDFQDLNTQMDEGEDPTVWNSFDISIPLLAQTTSTQFRWQQRNQSGSGFDNWAIDNLEISTLDVEPVPEPSSLALFGIGTCFAGIAAARRRRRDKKRDAVV